MKAPVFLAEVFDPVFVGHWQRFVGRIASRSWAVLDFAVLGPAVFALAALVFAAALANFSLAIADSAAACSVADFSVAVAFAGPAIF